MSSSSPDLPRALVAGDPREVGGDIGRRLGGRGWCVLDVVSSGARAIEVAFHQRPDLLAVDAALAGEPDGLAVAERIAGSLDIPVLLWSAHDERELLARSRRLETHGLLLPPFSDHALDSAIELAQHRHRARRAERELRDLLEAVPDAMLLVGADGRIECVNEQACALFGYDRDLLVGAAVESLVPDQLRAGHIDLRDAYFEHPVRRTLSATRDLFCQRGDGRRLPVEIGLSPISVGGRSMVVCAVRDTSTRRELEQRLRHSQKMLVVGQLASAVAHDFNNILTALGFSIFALKRHFQPLPGLANRTDPLRLLEQMESTTTRAGALSRQLLSLSKSGEASPRVVRGDELLHGISVLVEQFVWDNVELRVAFGAEGALIEVDPMQLEQVVLNLVVNACDAMPDGGRLEITSGTDDGPEGGRGWYRMTVRDTGKGMDDETFGRMFEPFFTTKSEGRGTGLGLSTVRDIVREWGGAVRARTTLGVGTAVDVVIPLSGGPVTNPEQPALDVPALTGTETVLLCENDLVMLKLMASLLRSAGYRVLSSSSGSEALRRVMQHEGDIDLLISDVVLPRVPGVELAGELRRHQSRLGVLFVTGHPESASLARRLPADGVLAKPFDSIELLRRVRQALENRR